MVERVAIGCKCEARQHEFAVGTAGAEPAHRDPLATERHLARDATGPYGRALGKTLALRAAQGDAVLLHHRSEYLTTRADKERKEVALGRVQGLEQG